MENSNNSYRREILPKIKNIQIFVLYNTDLFLLNFRGNHKRWVKGGIPVRTISRRIKNDFFFCLLCAYHAVNYSRQKC